MGDYAISSEGVVYKIDLKNKKYTKFQKLPTEIDEAYGLGPYVFDDQKYVYKLVSTEGGKSTEFRKVYKIPKSQSINKAIPPTRYDKLRAAKHLEILNMSTDLLLIVVDYMSPEIL